MLFKCQKFIATAVFLLVACASVAADSLATASIAQEDDNYLRQANQHYQQGDYAQSKVFYERALTQALAQGKPASSIYYNLGSVCYKLKLYKQSKQYFSKLLTHHKLKAVAYYNLALIENKQDKTQSAIKLFNESKKASSDAQLSALVDQQLFKLQKQATRKVKKAAKKDWNAYLYLSPGYDSNIRFAPLDIASDESGSFVQLYGLFDKRIAGEASAKKDPALLITSSLFLSNYFSTDFNDYNIYDIGLRYLLPLSEWSNTLEFNIKRSSYGHNDYQRFYVATAKARRKFSDGNSLRLRYRYEQIESLDPLFDYLAGHRQKLRLGYQFKWPSDALNLWYELELNDRENTANRNYSPTRNSFRLRYEQKLDATNKVYAELEYRHSDYQPTAVQDRLDKRYGYLLAYVNAITPDWQLLARWRFRNNRSTDAVFSYDRHVAMLTLRKKF